MCGRQACNPLTPDCTWSEEHRRKSEARTVSRWSREDRQAFYRMVEQKRGNMAAVQLVADVRAAAKPR